MTPHVGCSRFFKPGASLAGAAGCPLKSYGVATNLHFWDWRSMMRSLVLADVTQAWVMQHHNMCAYKAI